MSGATNDTYTGSQIAIGTPADSDTCRVYDFCYSANGAAPLAYVSAVAKITSLPMDADSKLHTGGEITGTYDVSTGLLYWDIVQGATARITVTELGIKDTVTIPASSTARLAGLL